MSKHRQVLAGLIAGFVIATGASPVGATDLDLYRFRGVVQDAVGRPLVGAWVSDGSKSVTTSGPDGRYELPEGDLRSFTLTASRDDLVAAQQTRQVLLPVDQTMDFVPPDHHLLYRLDSSVDSPYITTRLSPATVTVNIRSFAPYPGTLGDTGNRSCVSVLDTRTNLETPAEFVAAEPAGSSLWALSLSLAEATPEATYSLRSETRDCADGTKLSTHSVATYVVDNTPPVIPPEDVSPGDLTTTVHSTSQYLAARVLDLGGSSVDPSSVTFNLEKLGGSASSIGGTEVASVTLRAFRSPTPVALDLGALYRLTVSASDRAGNVTTFQQRAFEEGGGFLASDSSPSTTTAQIPPTSCTLSPGTTPATKTATCTATPVKLAATTVNFGHGVRRAPDSGFVNQSVPLTTVVISDGVVTIVANPAIDPRTVSMNFEVDAPSTTTLTAVAPEDVVSLGTITVQVPGTWNSATISMSPVQTRSAALATCNDPTSGSTGLTPKCSSDPMADDYFVTLDETTPDPEAKAGQLASLSGGSVVDVFNTATAYEAKGFFLHAPLNNLAAVSADTDTLGIRRVSKDWKREDCESEWLRVSSTSYCRPSTPAIADVSPPPIDCTYALACGATYDEMTAAGLDMTSLRARFDAAIHAELAKLGLPDREILPTRTAASGSNLGLMFFVLLPGGNSLCSGPSYNGNCGNIYFLSLDLFSGSLYIWDYSGVSGSNRATDKWKPCGDGGGPLPDDGIADGPSTRRDTAYAWGWMQNRYTGYESDSREALAPGKWRLDPWTVSQPGKPSNTRGDFEVHGGTGAKQWKDSGSAGATSCGCIKGSPTTINNLRSNYGNLMNRTTPGGPPVFIDYGEVPGGATSGG